MARIWIAALLIALTPVSAHAAKLKVVATFSILGDMVDHVGGSNIDLTTLVGPNSNSHTHEPTPANVQALEDADLVIVNGISYENWIGRLIVASGYSGPIIVAGKNITPLNINDKLEQDPHAWHSLSNAKDYVRNIRDALIENDRRNSAKYKDNTERYLDQIEEMETWITNEISKVPAEKRFAITHHDGFQYLGRYYGIKFISPTGPRDDAAPTAENIAKVLDQMRKMDIRALFMENISNDQTIKSLKEQGNGYIAGTLYSDALSGPNGPAATYLEMFRHNVTLLTEGMMKNSGIAPVQHPDNSEIISIP
jgi:zinc/manganese transport system substrate-binding protein